MKLYSRYINITNNMKVCTYRITAEYRVTSIIGRTFTVERIANATIYASANLQIGAALSAGWPCRRPVVSVTGFTSGWICWRV